MHISAYIGPIDLLNPGAGYTLRISRSDNGETILFTSIDPATGFNLHTAADCVRVLGYYTGGENHA